MDVSDRREMDRREMDRREVEELLGAYALDACDAGEIGAVEELLALDPVLAGEAERLRHAAAWIGATEALEPPSGLRTAVLAAARARQTPDPAVDVYTGEMDALAEVIDDLDTGQLELDTWNGLSVRDLIVHCAAQESLAAQLAGVPTVPEVVATDIDERTAALRERLAGLPAADAVALWRESVDAVEQWATEPENRDATVRWLGADIARPDVLTILAFETWIHADDIRRAVGKPVVSPPASHLARMSDFSGRTTGFGLMMVGRARPGRTARLVLTGEGGGEWLIAMGGGAPGATPDVTLTTDVVDWCRLVGERIEPGELDCTVEGDAGLAEDLLAAASAFATL
jgi:uncharacterized protein (TIGR03083 family)